MQIILTLIIGLFVGIVAKFLMPGKDPGGMIITSLLGIAGALTAGYLGQLVGLYEQGQPVGFVASVVGAMILLFVYRVLIKGK